MDVKVYRGRKGILGEPILTIQGNEVYVGHKGFADEPIATIDGEEVYDSPTISLFFYPTFSCFGSLFRTAIRTTFISTFITVKSSAFTTFINFKIHAAKETS